MKQRRFYGRFSIPILIVPVLIAAVFVLAAPDVAGAAADGPRQEYTCSMHPQVRSFDPDERCPICGMELIPVPMEDDPVEGEPPRLRVSEAEVALMEIRTWPAERRAVEVELRLLGRVDFNESLLRDVVLFSPGYVETLKADFAWKAVGRGETIAEIYSPEVTTAFRELLVARKAGGATLAAARSRLTRLGVSPGQIEEIIETGEVPRTYRVTSPIDGVVKRLGVREGDRLGEGGLLVRLADLSTVWVRLQAYETELSWVGAGDPLRFTLPAYPGEVMEGRVVWVDPVLDDRTRTVGLRAEVPNPDGLLKPGLFARGHLYVPPPAPNEDVDHDAHDAPAPPDAHDAHDTPAAPDAHDAHENHDIHHPDHFHDDHPDPDDHPVPLVIPASAPLFTGRRSLVYVRVPDAERPTFEAREVLLGPRAGDYYIVREGLVEGEIVVVHGQFKIDSELQIRGRPSMMSPEGAPPPVHDHGPADHEPPAAPDHDHGPDDHEPPAATPDHDHAVPAELSEEMARFLEVNFELVAALSADDPSAAAGIARAADQPASLDEVEIEEGDRSRWDDLSAEISAGLNALAETEDIGVQRRNFERFSDALTAAVGRFGTGGVRPVYRARCPMVEGREGFWLQSSTEITNPYFGAAMLRCGEIVSTLAAP